LNWMQEMIRIYDEYYSFGKNMNPLFHEEFNADLEITINAEGEMLNARIITDKEEKRTIIPVTEKSAIRTNNVAKFPHPLSDQLRFIDANYSEQYYLKNNNGLEIKQVFSDNRKLNSLYKAGLKDWADYKYSHPKVHAIRKFIEKGNIICQLKERGVIEENIKEDDVIKKLVRFIVVGCGPVEECWRDQSLVDNYIMYYISTKLKDKSEQNDKSKLNKIQISYLSGEYQPITKDFPIYIRNAADRARIFSYNRKKPQDFTYLGRFKDEDEILSIGAIDSQKMHNALKWMLRTRGISSNDFVTLVWESNFNTIPMPDKGTNDLFADFLTQDQTILSDSQNKEILQKLFTREYSDSITPTSSVYLLSFDSATKGRLSLVQQATLQTSQYLSNLEKWHIGASWKHFYKNKATGYYTSYIGVPGINKIVRYLYGHENDKKLIDIKGNEQLVNIQMRKLYTCIVLDKPLPVDMVNTAIHKASMPESYKEKSNWNTLLSISCSLIKKQYYQKKEEYTLAIEKGEKGKRRDYLYGRLLAIADRIEEGRLRSENTDHPTNAIRYMNMFSQHPFRTWKIIHENIIPYLNGYNEASRIYYVNLIQSVMTEFKEGDFENDKPLNGLYLLGYYSQREDMKSRSKERQDKLKENAKENEGED
jgi:CRISPR-associated protein Csd1